MRGSAAHRAWGLFVLVLAATWGTVGLPTASALSVPPIEAALDPPVTTYLVRPDGIVSNYTYRWTISPGACGSFVSSKNSATWYHGEDSGCPHDSTIHPGTVTVVVTAKSGEEATCTYPHGSASGQGDACTGTGGGSVPPTSTPKPPGRRPPNAEILNPANGSTALAGRDLVLHYRATDPDGDLRSVNLAIYREDDPRGRQFHVLARGEGNHTIPGANLTPGAYVFTVVATDETFEFDEAVAIVLVLPETTSEPAHVTVEERQCDAYYTGQFQPSQGAWQDDTAFEDRTGMQLLRTGGASYLAELPMVVDRASLLFGVREVHDEVDQTEPMRNLVYVSGMAFGRQPVDAFLRFTLTQNGVPKKIWDSPVLTKLYILGECDLAGHPFLAKLPADKGTIPAPFTFTEGPYTLKAELIRDDIRAPTGIAVTVDGTAVRTRAQRVLFVPVIATAPSREPWMIGVLNNDTKRIADAFADHAADSMPSPTQRWNTTKLHALDHTDMLERAAEVDGVGDKVERIYNLLTESGDAHTLRVAAINKHLRRALVDDRWALGMDLAGADRAVIVLHHADFEEVLEVDEDTLGLSTAAKVAYVRRDGSHWTVIHELAHMLPDFLWSTSEMKDECAHDYHNAGELIGNGGRVTQAQRPAPRIYTREFGYMSGGGTVEFDDDTWTDQCTYRHLVEAMQGNVDPPVILVRALLGYNATGPQGVLLPAYETEGVVDLDGSVTGNWSFVVLDAEANEIGRYPFAPTFETADAHPLLVVSIVQRLPKLEGAARVELHGPEGLLDGIELGGAAPTLALGSLPPALPAGPRVVTWTTDANASVSLLHSADGGQTWTPLAIEEPGLEAAEVNITFGTNVIRVIARKGSASTTSDATVEGPAPPTAPTPPGPAIAGTTSPTASALPPPPSPTAPAGTPPSAASRGVPLPAWLPLVALAMLALRRRR